MAQTIVKFDRRFQMWEYSVGHSQLLLRSVKDQKNPTRVDVYFKGVAALNMPTLFHGLQVSEVGEDQWRSLKVDFGALDLIEQKFFKVTGDGWQGWVVAYVVSSHEDDGEYYTESKFCNLRFGR